MPRISFLAVFGFAALAAGPVLATEVYRHVDANGVVHYSDEPPAKGAKPISLPPIQVVGPLSRATAGSASASRAPGLDMTGAAPLAVSIASPAPDETFRGDDRRLMVSVRMDQPLPEGYGLLYLLDGTAQHPKATRALNFTMEGVERGEHMLSVVTVDPKGREVGRSAPVIVHMKPPTVQAAEARKAEREADRPAPRPRITIP